MALHIINQSPFDSSSFDDCFSITTHEDCIVLIDDGVYVANYLNKLNELNEQEIKCPIYALDESVNIRGIPKKICKPTINLITYEEFVALCVQYQPISSW